MRLKMFDAIKVMKINIEEEDYKERYDCEEDDENVEDGRNERGSIVILKDSNAINVERNLQNIFKHFTN